MNLLKRYEREEEITYFKKKKSVSIEDVSIGSVVYLKIKTNLKTTIREVEYYGKIINCTKSYFSVPIYFQSLGGLCNCKTLEINRKQKSSDKYIIKRI